jgi:hypothetical protein
VLQTPELDHTLGHARVTLMLIAGLLPGWLRFYGYGLIPCAIVGWMIFRRYRIYACFVAAEILTLIPVLLFSLIEGFCFLRDGEFSAALILVPAFTYDFNELLYVPIALAILTGYLIAFGWARYSNRTGMS